VPNVQIAFPPEGLDPDDWVRRDGPEAVKAGLAQARTPLAFLEDLIGTRELDRREAAARGAELISRLADPLARDIWLQEASARFGVGVEALREAARREAQAGRAGAEPGSGSPVPSRTSRGAASWSRLARECLRAVLADPSRAAPLAAELDKAGLESEEELRDLLGWLAQAWDEAPGDRTGLLARARAEHPLGALAAAIALEEGTEPTSVEILSSQIRRLGLKSRAEELDRKIRRAEETGDQKHLSEYLIEKQQIVREISRLAREGRGAAGLP
jgi:DNA primase